MEQRVRRLVAPQQGERGTAAIYTATQDLFEFLVSAYHLKDALVADQAVARKTVENAINNSSTLALLADLANLEKHRELSRKPRTGEVPIVESFSDYSESDEWRLMVTIRHMGKQVDGVVFASEVMDEWRSHLTAWGLIDGSLRLSGEKTQRRRSRPC